MNVVTDLAARAVSFIILLQDTVLKSKISKNVNEHLEVKHIFTDKFTSEFEEHINSDVLNAAEFRKKAIELVWISVKPPEDKEADAANYTKCLCNAVAAWVSDHKDFLFEKVCTCGSFPAPYSWRQAISELLYIKDENEGQRRVDLAKALQYLPMQIVLALGAGTLNAHKQRILQGWQVDRKNQETLLNRDELSLADEYEQEFNLHAEELLRSDSMLIAKLNEKSVPLSFDLIFHHELNEIEENRKLREQEQCVTDKAWKEKTKLSANNTNNPYARAADMQLFALSFSGGGIRSATLNLGILQGLAQHGLLNKFDYLSTVSGGGYIGSWLAAWIKRNGSLVKVSDRLNTEKSPDPFGEEVRPIRWLRMFSNYFAPNASIMSTDAWTVGATWLRNTLLNQFIILLLFLSLLLGISLFFATWYSNELWMAPTGIVHVLLWSLLLTAPLAAIAALSMQTYHREHFPPAAAFKKEEINQAAPIVIPILFAGAFLVSAWLFGLKDSSTTLFQKLHVLWPAAAVCFLALMGIAVYGRYDKCVSNKDRQQLRTWAGITYTALLSAAIGLLALAGVWEFFESFREVAHEKLLFIVGLPMVMEVFALTVLVRMALLGRFFPDERREWWGRMGAKLQRFVFLYILLAGASLVGKDWLYEHFSGKDAFKAFGITGGWAAIVGMAVKAGFSAATSGKEKKGKASWLNILAMAGPYLFAAGLFIFLPALLTPFQNGIEWVLGKVAHWVNITVLSGRWQLPEKGGSGSRLEIVSQICMLLIMLATAYRLAYRIGVNEFSMHHFYRNRLVRAYLGATRRRNDRDRTANPFTGFDMQDDVKLRELQNKYGYYGPYPVLNTALNASQVTDLDRQDRKAESFVFSPLYCGFDFSMSRSSANIKSKSYDYGLRPTADFAYPNGPTIGTAMAISGAAVNPNQGYHSSAATAFLLTVFNVQMGWWIGNPRKGKWQQADPTFGLGYIFYNLIGKTNTSNDFVCLSDGGHFDNMGLYEMVRRRCTFILLGDGEQDQDFTCEGLANAIRRCRIDFGAEITINTDEITKQDENRHSKSHYVLGTIRYANNTEGTLLYIKSSITGNESEDIAEYAIKNAGFPHQTTADQFFDEEQFESYRKLGTLIANSALSDSRVKALVEI